MTTSGVENHIESVERFPSRSVKPETDLIRSLTERLPGAQRREVRRVLDLVEAHAARVDELLEVQLQLANGFEEGVIRFPPPSQVLEHQSVSACISEASARGKLADKELRQAAR